MKKFQQMQLNITTSIIRGHFWKFLAFHNLAQTLNPFLRDHLLKRPLLTFLLSGRLIARLSEHLRYRMSTMPLSMEVHTEALENRVRTSVNTSVCSSLCLARSITSQEMSTTFCFKSTFCRQIVSCFKYFLIK